ncbi:MAG: hypothetical protein FWH29_02925 [Methanobrevibacter sp.]|nr:hypothetical protein [Methanobrevibacter sp.]
MELYEDNYRFCQSAKISEGKSYFLEGYTIAEELGDKELRNIFSAYGNHIFTENFPKRSRWKFWK